MGIDTLPLVLRFAMGGGPWMVAGPGRVTRGDALGVVMQDDADDAF